MAFLQFLQGIYAKTSNSSPSIREKCVRGRLGEEKEGGKLFLYLKINILAYKCEGGLQNKEALKTRVRGNVIFLLVATIFSLTPKLLSTRQHTSFPDKNTQNL